MLGSRHRRRRIDGREHPPHGNSQLETMMDLPAHLATHQATPRRAQAVCEAMAWKIMWAAARRRLAQLAVWGATEVGMVQKAVLVLEAAHRQ